MNTKTRILIVEDEWLIAEVTRKILERLGYTVVSVAVSGEEAVRKAKELKPDLILMDIVLEGKMDGIEAAGLIHSRFGIPIIFQTAYSDEKILERAKEIKPFGYLIKPVQERELAASISMALHKHEVDEKLRENQKALRRSLNEAIRRRAEVSALLESSHAVLKYRKFEDAAKAIFDSCKKAIGAAAGYIALLTSDGSENDVCFLDSGGRPCDVDPNLPMPIRGLRAEAYRTGKAVYENDFSGSEWAPFLPEGHAALDNVLFAPLIIEGKAVGLMGLANKPGGFTENDSAMATAFAEHAAIALQNSRALESLENSEARFRALAESAVDAIISADSSGKIVYWNLSAQRIFGYSSEEAVGMELAQLMPERFRAAHAAGFKRVAGGGEPRIVGKTVELIGLRKGGKEFPLQLSLSTWQAKGQIFFTASLHDIAIRKKRQEALKKSNEDLRKTILDLKKMQTLLIRSEKLASIGTLSAGVAHEILNPLNIISTITQLMQMKDLDDEDRENLDEIMNQVRRATKITNNLRMFAHQKRGEMGHVQIHGVLEKTLPLLERDLNLDNILIERNYEEALPEVNADEDQLAQVFLNLLTNARDALRPRKGGVISIKTRRLNDKVEINFSDNGPGIPVEIMDKIFDPFFSTKDPGQGTGMGLAIVYSIMENHSGSIRVESGEGKGAAFVITLPVAGGG